MQVVTAKTARFPAIVKACGQPEQFTLWENPRKNPKFIKAMEQNRVMTVKQENVGTKKDYGLVGFRKDRNAAYLIFPKKLDAYDGKRIVGIDYGLIRVPAPKDPVRVFERETKRVVRPRRDLSVGDTEEAPSEAAPEPRTFSVKVRVTATLDLTHEVEALDRVDAKRKALEIAAGEDLDFANAERSQRILEIDAA